MQSPPEFSREVAHALSHLYDPDILRKHKLLHLMGLSQQPNAQNLLRERLIQAIETLKPAPDVPVESRAWRVYKVLHLRYVQQLDQEQTAYQIGVGVRHLRREQSAAVTALADELFQHIDPEQVGSTAANSQPISANDEFAWLQENIQQETSNANEIVDMAISLVLPLANSRGIQLETHLEANLPPALILPAALRQALISLTTLAIHRLPAGKITFSAALHQQQIVLLIAAVSDAPLLPETPSTLESLRTVRMILGPLSSGLKTYDDTKSLEFTLRLPALGQVIVLMIDDNRDVADLFKRYTYGTEFSIEYLPNADQLFETIENVQPRVILLDIMIPKVDGWELLGRLRQHPRTQGLPIIVCSVLPERELALALGATAYLAKPVKRTALLEALNRVLYSEGAVGG